MMSNVILTSEETIVMGDFWSGNIIIRTKESADGSQTLEKVLVVDWEITKLGTPGNDIGQFAAEVYLPLAFYPACSDAANAIIEHFCSAYRSESQLFDKKVVDIASKQLGSHITVLTPEIKPWSENKARAREVVEEGLKYLTGESIFPLFVAFDPFIAVKEE